MRTEAVRRQECNCEAGCQRRGEKKRDGVSITRERTNKKQEKDCRQNKMMDESKEEPLRFHDLFFLWGGWERKS